jgi:hypothetical protein
MESKEEGERVKLEKLITQPKGPVTRVAVGGVEFSDASVVLSGLYSLEHRAGEGGSGRSVRLSEILEHVFASGLQALHAAAKAAAADYSKVKDVPPALLGALASGVPSCSEIRTACQVLGVPEAGHPPSDWEARKLGDMLGPLRRYELAAENVALRLASRLE